MKEIERWYKVGTRGNWCGCKRPRQTGCRWSQGLVVHYPNEYESAKSTLIETHKRMPKKCLPVNESIVAEKKYSLVHAVYI